MRKLALAFAASFAVCFLVAAAPAPTYVPELLEGQTRCGSDLCIGSKSTQVDIQGTATVGGINNQVVSGSNFDGGTTKGVHLEFGTLAASSGRAGVTFAHTFASPPQCTCTQEVDGGCNLEGPASTTAVAFHTAQASSAVEFICVGTR